MLGSVGDASTGDGAMTLTKIAAKIDEHLDRFEADPAINAWDRPGGTRPYYHAGAFRDGNRVLIRYVSYQHTHSLTRAEAVRYLDWLNAGNVGKDHQMPKVEATK